MAGQEIRVIDLDHPEPEEAPKAKTPVLDKTPLPTGTEIKVLDLNDSPNKVHISSEDKTEDLVLSRITMLMQILKAMPNTISNEDKVASVNAMLESWGITHDQLYFQAVTKANELTSEVLELNKQASAIEVKRQKIVLKAKEEFDKEVIKINDMAKKDSASINDRIVSLGETTLNLREFCEFLKT